MSYKKMEIEHLNETLLIKSNASGSDLTMEKEKVLEKGSMEHFLIDSYERKNDETYAKELMQKMDDKDEVEEKEVSVGKQAMKELSTNDKEIFKYPESDSKIFNFETLNRDLADIEERLRATRLSWNKNGKSSTNDSSDMGSIQKDMVRKSWSMIDIEKRPYSNGSSLNDLENGKRYSGDKLACDSPALSEGLLKWDYGADIGLTQDDSDDMEPITWPVTAEQAQRDAQASEKGGMGRHMKPSLSQGSFLSSPDPEDRHNLIAKISAEYKASNFVGASASSLRKDGPSAVSTEIISLANGKYDDTSARQIMEQAEAAEKRLRHRLEAVKALHLSENSRLQNFDDQHQLPTEYDSKIADDTRLPMYADSLISREDSFDRLASNHDLVSEAVKGQQKKLIEEIISDTHRQLPVEDDCKSPTSITNTGRTTTMESTHTSSDYGKAPVFTGEAYGSRKESNYNDSNFVMYSKQNRDTLSDKLRSFESRDMRNPRQICGIPPELDTISSRETLQITDEKKDGPLVSPVKKSNGNANGDNDIKNTDDIADHLSDKDVNQEHSLQAKWNQFKSMMKEDEYSNLLEKTNIRTPVQYHPLTTIKFNDLGSNHRQQSTTTTFTTITNMSPRYDSFATDIFKNPQRELHSNDFNPVYRRSGTEEDAKHRSNSGKVADEKLGRSENQLFESNQYINSRSRSGKRLTNGNGGGKDNEDNDDEISQTERRKLRHAAELAKFKRRFGSGPLDCETTASELEHDDLSKFKRNLMEKESRKKQLSQMLTDMSKQGVAEDNMQDLTDVSQSTSVDTMLLMNKMSHLLKNQKSNKVSRRDPRKQSKEKSNRKYLPDPKKKETNRTNSNKIIESDDAKLILKHLMLKQKVKWLADCAREESRRRKIRKLDKLMDIYEQGNPVIIPDDLQTDTATLMGSDRDSQDDLCSQSDSCSVFVDGHFDIDAPLSPTVGLDQFQTKKLQQKRSKSPSFRKQYYKSKQLSLHSKKEEAIKNERKHYPASDAWHIPLRETRCHERGDFNDSNEYNCESPKNEHTRKRFRSPNDYTDSELTRKPTNLTAKERLQLRRELEMARQRNAHECQKDIRHLKTGNTKVATGGLAWAIGSFKTNDEARKSSLYNDENFKEKGNGKSELQLAFENRMEGFISRSRQRQKRIRLAVDERRYESQMNLERARLFVSSGESGCPKRRRPVTQPDPLSAERTNTSSPKIIKNRLTKSAPQNGIQSQNAEYLYKPRRRNLSKSEMKSQSAKKYHALPEVQAKYLDERRKAKMQNNRMKMHLYGERILQSVLRNRGPWISNQN